MSGLIGLSTDELPRYQDSYDAHEAEKQPLPTSEVEHGSPPVPRAGGGMRPLVAWPNFLCSLNDRGGIRTHDLRTKSGGDSPPGIPFTPINPGRFPNHTWSIFTRFWPVLGAVVAGAMVFGAVVAGPAALVLG